MEPNPTYDEAVPRPTYTVDSYSVAATAAMPSEPFHEREDEAADQRP